MTLTVFGLTSWKHKQTTEIRNDFKKYYDQFNVDGSFVLYDPQDDKYILYNQNQFNQRFTPASTFKIPHTLMALNEGVIRADSIIFWDKTDKGMTPWNKDQTLESAFKLSCVWCYKEFTLKIAASKYKEYLEKLNYGNKTIGPDVSDFWLDGPGFQEHIFSFQFRLLVGFDLVFQFLNAFRIGFSEFGALFFLG